MKSEYLLYLENKNSLEKSYLIQHKILFLVFQDYFEYITRNHEAFANNPLMQVYVNTTEGINTFEVESPKIKVMKIYLN